MWSYTTGDDIYSCPAISTNGTIYVGSADNKLYALNPDGTLAWSYATGGGIQSSPSVSANGTIYVGSNDNKIHAIEGGAGGLMDSAWPKFRQNLRNTGFTEGGIGLYPGQTGITLHTSNATTMTGSQLGASYGLNGITPLGKVAAVNATITTLGGAAVFRYALSGVSGAIGSMAFHELYDANGTHRAYNAYSAAPNLNTDGSWWITDANNNHKAFTESLSSDQVYYLCFTVTDNGACDADRNLGVIFDPVVLVDPPGGASGSGSGAGGCALNPGAGFGADLLLLMVAGAALLLGRRTRPDRLN